jgi:hypothetical protein
LLVCGTARAAGELAVDPVPGSGTAVAPGQTNVQLLKVRVTALGAATITGMSVAFAGTAAGDIAAVRLSRSADPDWEAPPGHALAEGSLASGSAFLPFVLSLDTGTVAYFTVTADIASNAADWDAVGLTMTGLTTDGTVTGIFPLQSINPASPVHVNAVATGLAVDAWPSSVTAGTRFTFTVSCVDAGGNRDRDWSGSILTVEGYPGAEPGGAPVYEGSGAWSTAEEGARSCACTCTAAETGRRIQVRDSLLGTVRSGSFDVTGGTPGTNRINIAPVGDQTAGIPFAVTLFITDGAGAPVTGYDGSTTVLVSDAGVVAAPAGTAPVLPSYEWQGDEADGRVILTVVAYTQYGGARLRARDPILGEAVSDGFAVAGGAAANYVITGPQSVRLRTATVYTAGAADTWGNALAAYAGSARVSCSEAGAVPDEPVLSFQQGTASFSMLFASGGSKVITLTETDGHGARGTLAVTVNRSPLPAAFQLTVPAQVEGGTAFDAAMTAVDDTGAVIADYNSPVFLSVARPAAITPSTVYLAGGAWKGALAVSGETLETAITVSDGEVTTASAARIKVEVADYARARTYPTVFKPRAGPVRIRYFLREDSTVHIRIYNAALDLIKEVECTAGSPGGRAGLNAVDWDGRGASDGSIGHSGGYPIAIDKGYETEWTGAVIKNY